MVHVVMPVFIIINIIVLEVRILFIMVIQQVVIVIIIDMAQHVRLHVLMGDGVLIKQLVSQIICCMYGIIDL